MLQPIPPNSWGCDCSVKVSADIAGKIAATPMNVNGAYTSKPVVFLFRYVSLSNPSAADITVDERDGILNAGLVLMLVQHVNYPAWVADADNGQAHGQAAVKHAQLVGYPAGAHLAVDMEGLKDVGPDVVMYLRAWAAEVHAAGYKVCMYVGYACGLTAAQQSTLRDQGIVDLFWSDFGNRPPPPGYGFANVQFAQIMFCGIPVDPDHAFPDQKGSVLVGMAKDPPPDPGLPSADSAPDHDDTKAA